MTDPGQKVGNEVERERQVSEGRGQTEFGNSRGARVSENNAVKPQFASHRQCNILESWEHDGVSFGLNLLKRPGTKQSACCDVDHSWLENQIQEPRSKTACRREAPAFPSGTRAMQPWYGAASARLVGAKPRHPERAASKVRSTAAGGKAVLLAAWYGHHVSVTARH